MAVSVIGLSPRDFWRLSLAEWRWLAAAFAPAAPETARRDDLNALFNQFPDEKQ